MSVQSAADVTDGGAAADESAVPPQEWPADAEAPTAADPEAPSSGGYGVLTGMIFAFLLLLLGAAIAVLVYLAGNTSFTLPTFGDEPRPEQTDATVTTPEQENPDAAGEAPLATGVCSEFCADIAARVGTSVIGADGGSAWQLTQEWSDVEVATLPADAVVAAVYEADAGLLEFTVWRFSGDAAAQEAYEQLSSDTGEPSGSGAVYENGSGSQSTFDGDSSRTVIWTVLSDDAQPWVMRVQGPDDDAVQQFYLALPF
ncbi:hypothetical protein [Microbacterium sp. SD291]|uniref:hypothetical protein n=1 Tax=Microbacterium sp. SD291 TaxID=2782007 RepID=UPI001A965939|nr:hypothetical protein [Microbacterium sp. SD291]MBO0980245.1 hypothetical protein [Microbacterium sp. SD291]